MVLTSKLKGKSVLIKQLLFEDTHILHKLRNIGLTEGSVVKVLDYDKTKNIIHLEIYNIDYVIREDDCKLIYVEEQKTKTNRT